MLHGMVQDGSQLVMEAVIVLRIVQMQQLGTLLLEAAMFSQPVMVLHGMVLCLLLLVVVQTQLHTVTMVLTGAVSAIHHSQLLVVKLHGVLNKVYGSLLVVVQTQLLTHLMVFHGLVLVQLFSQAVVTVLLSQVANGLLLVVEQIQLRSVKTVLVGLQFHLLHQFSQVLVIK